MKNPLGDPKAVGARLKKLRESSDFSLRELSARSGIAASFLSKIEAGKASPTIMTLVRIVEALDLDVAEFFREGPVEDPAEAIVFPRKAMKALRGTDRHWVLAFPSHPSIQVELSYNEYEPQTRTQELERHPVDICGWVLKGQLTLDVPGRGVFRASKGDAFYIKAGTEHVSRNERSSTLQMVVARMTRWVGLEHMLRESPEQAETASSPGSRA